MMKSDYRAMEINRKNAVVSEKVYLNANETISCIILHIIKWDISQILS